MQEQDKINLEEDIKESEPIEHLMEFEGYRRFEEELDRMESELKQGLVEHKVGDTIDKIALDRAHYQGRYRAIRNIRNWFQMHRDKAQSAREAIRNGNG